MRRRGIVLVYLATMGVLSCGRDWPSAVEHDSSPVQRSDMGDGLCPPNTTCRTPSQDERNILTAEAERLKALSFLPCKWAGEALSFDLSQGKIDMFDDEGYAVSPETGQTGLVGGRWNAPADGNFDIDPLSGLMKGGGISLSAGLYWSRREIPAHEGAHSYYDQYSANAQPIKYDDDRDGAPVNAYDVGRTCQP